MIPFNKPPVTGCEEQYVLESMRSLKISGDGEFSRKCQSWFERNINCPKALLTPSCTDALEMAAILIDIKPGDEVIMPSYTFVSTANAFVLRGAKIVFVDIRPDTMNIDESLIEQAVTVNTKAIVPVHYAGVSCDMDIIMDIAKRHNLYVVEDAAQAIMSTYKEKPLGTIGHLGAYSFHETKNISSGGEGGLLIINDEKFIERAEIIREKGTNRSQFARGKVDKYTWVDIGSSYLPSELQAAYLWGQLENVDKIQEKRLRIWNAYYKAFKNLEKAGKIILPVLPDDCKHNAHMFHLRVKDIKQRTALLDHLYKMDILAVFHYVPLHNSIAGKKYSFFNGVDKVTTKASQCLVRLPIYYNLTTDELNKVIDEVISFFGSSDI